ncbi:hypothetical protein GF369_03355 [Candidatus Peregrinibacteria bacterium]|nr:hypothetical protein [Candidatus Peregrinibacteria bacterium]
MKKFVFLLLLITLVGIPLFVQAGEVQAARGGPAKINITLAPGSVYNGSVFVENASESPVLGVIEQRDFNIVSAGVFEYSEEPLLRGLLQWTEFEDYKEPVLNPGEKYTLNYTIKIPESADPGTYSTGFLITTPPADAEKVNGSYAVVGGRVLSQLYITVEGDYVEDLELKSFSINNNKFLNGNIAFDVAVENKGDVMLQPSGEITIYNSEGEQVKGAYAIVKTFEDEEVVTDRENAIPVNPNSASITPGAVKVYQVEWTHRKADLGDYTAKLEMSYGQEKQTLEADTTFELEKNFSISTLEAESSYNSSLPVTFNASLKNIGNLPVQAKGNFSISNIFGSQKMEIEFTDEELALEGGEEKSINNLLWADGFALGYYNATLSITANGDLLTSSVGFWVISWWQIVILIALVVIVIFGIFKGVNKYSKMKKKLESIDKNKEQNKN